MSQSCSSFKLFYSIATSRSRTDTGYTVLAFLMASPYKYGKRLFSRSQHVLFSLHLQFSPWFFSINRCWAMIDDELNSPTFQSPWSSNAFRFVITESCVRACAMCSSASSTSVEHLQCLLPPNSRQASLCISIYDLSRRDHLYIPQWAMYIHLPIP